MISHRRPALFYIVIARGDGSRLVSLTAPRWILTLVMIVGCLTLTGLSALVADWGRLRASRVDQAMFEHRLAAERQTNAQLRAALDMIGQSVATWPALHARILSTFGQPAPPLPTVAAAAIEPGQIAAIVRQATGMLGRIAGVMTKLNGVLAQLPTTWPVRAAINSEFGPRPSPWTGETEFHRGIDIATAEGQPVRAPAPGAIAFAGIQGTYGLSVVVDHGADVHTLYGHLSRVAVRRGERVERGQLLGQSGNTGRSTGPHLHYEITIAGRPVNPRAHLWD